MLKTMALPKGVTPPNHVAIIPDGNRRWAKARGLDTLAGHRKGLDRVVELVRASRDMGIHTMTLWAFSTENWHRSKGEVTYLMDLFTGMIDENLKEAHERQSKIIHLGRKDRIPKKLLEKIIKAERETADYSRHVLNVALDYGGHDEVLRAIKRLMEDASAADIRKNGFLYQSLGTYHHKYPIYKFSQYLDTGNQPYPYPDLVIRTSGEQRTSGLMAWQLAYSEFYFEPKDFPDFTPVRLRKAVLDYAHRQRRFGGN